MNRPTEKNQDEQFVLNKIEELLSGRKNAAYQFITLESILRVLEKQPDKEMISLIDLFNHFSEISYRLRTEYQLNLGGDKENTVGKSSANGIIDAFVEKYNLYATKQLNDTQIEILRNKIMSTNINKAPIDAVTKESLGLFKKEVIQKKEYLVLKKQTQKVLLANIAQIREKNNLALTKYLSGIPQNNIQGLINISGEPIMGGSPKISVKEASMPTYTEKELIQSIHTYITQKGFTFALQTIQNLYLSLKTKPFAILAGISGTGKSKIVELFAEAIGATTENGRYHLVSVRPDWSDSTELLGYRDLNNSFHPGILTTIIQQAIKDSSHPYFVCLDEMNLARVEYYLSDFLSIIESRKWREDEIVTHPLLQATVIGEDSEMKNTYDGLYIPDNLYMIGTVNMDETTFPFSKKVLDRANTIEFSTIDLMEGLEELEGEKGQAIPVGDISNKYLRSEYLTIRDCMTYKEEVKKIIVELQEINKRLEPSHAHFAYRMRDEIVFYLLYNQRFSLMPFEEAFDLQLAQKILPRITGSHQQVLKVLEVLQGYTKGKYLQTYKKLEWMIERYEADGFTSYWS